MATMTSTVIVWIDGSDKPSAIVEELSSSGLTIIQVTQDSLTDGDITKADAIVLCIDTDISSISEVQSRQARLNSTSPLIARVDRNNFELAIQVMRKGAATVVPSQQQDFTDWCETLSIVKVSKPMQQSSLYLLIQ